MQIEEPWLIYYLYAASIETNDSSFIATDENGCAIMLTLNDTIHLNQEGFIDNSGAIFFRDYYDKSNMIMDDLCYTPFMDKYCPIKLVFNSNVHFGWIRLTSNSMAVTLKDFAYHATPNMMILAGQTESTRITKYNPEDPFTITCQGGNLKIICEAADIKIKHVRIINFSGQYIHEIDILESKASINVVGITPGFYIVQLVEANKLFAKKLFISNY